MVNDPDVLRANADLLLRLAAVAGHHGDRTWQDTVDLVPASFDGRAAAASLTAATALRDAALNGATALGDAARILYDEAARIDEERRLAAPTSAPSFGPGSPLPLTAFGQ